MGQAIRRSCVVTSVDELWNEELGGSAQTITALAVAVPEVAFRITVNTLSGDSGEFTINQINNIHLTIADLKNEIATSAWRIPCACQKLTSVDPSVVGILQDDDCLTDRHYFLIISLEMLNPNCAGAQLAQEQFYIRAADAVLQDLEQLGPSGLKSVHAATMAALSQCLGRSIEPSSTEFDIGCRNMLFYESICPQVMRVFVQFADKGDQRAIDTLCSLACHPRSHICSLALSLVPKVAEKGDQHAVGEVTKCLLRPQTTNAYQLAAVQAITQLAEKGDRDLAAAVAKCYYSHWSGNNAGKDRSGVEHRTVGHALEVALDALGETTSAAVEERRVLNSRLDCISRLLPRIAGSVPTETYDQIRDLVRSTMQWKNQPLEHEVLANKISELDAAISEIEQHLCL